MVADEKTPNWRHKIVLVDREEMTIEGVTGLGSFDEREIIMETEQGQLTIKGENLNIQQLNLEKTNIVIEGLFKALSYNDTPHDKKSLWEKLLR